MIGKKKSILVTSKLGSFDSPGSWRWKEKLSNWIFPSCLYDKPFTTQRSMAAVTPDESSGPRDRSHLAATSPCDVVLCPVAKGNEDSRCARQHADACQSMLMHERKDTPDAAGTPVRARIPSWPQPHINAHISLAAGNSLGCRVEAIMWFKQSKGWQI